MLALRRFEQTGELVACPPEQAGLQLWALVHGLASLELQDVFSGPAIDLWRSAIATHVQGLRQGRSTSPPP